MGCCLQDTQRVHQVVHMTMLFPNVLYFVALVIIELNLQAYEYHIVRFSNAAFIPSQPN